MTRAHMIVKSLVVILALAVTSSTRAQQLPLLPIVRPAFELDKSRLGSWAEYRATEGAVSTIQRHALVSEGPQGYLLEVRVESAIFSEPIVLRFAMAAGGSGRPESPGFIDVMIGRNQPMRVAIPPPPPFEGFLAESARVGSGTIKTPAGNFTATHYRHQIEGDSWEYWVARAAPPLGIVRSIKKLGPSSSVMELNKLGVGARATMLAEPRPVDQREFVRAMTNNLRGAK